MHEIPTPPRWFLMRPPSHREEGPFDIDELAALLRTGDITGSTLTKREGDEEWIPFRDRHEFKEALDVPVEAIEQHLQDEVAQEGEPWWTPRRLFFLGCVVFPPLVIVLMFYSYEPDRFNSYLSDLWENVQRILHH